jgi:hypothetical protein
MKKLIVTSISLLIVLGCISYIYVSNAIVNPFTIDATRSFAVNDASKFINTTQEYEFRFLNTSDKKLKLISIDLQGYQGIEVGELKVDGKPLTIQKIPSHRVYNPNGNGWSTNNQGVDVKFNVKVLEPTIKNPKSALFTYSYFGINHQQVVNLPGSQQNTSGSWIQTNDTRSIHVSMIPTIFQIIVLIILYWKREENEDYLALKLIGYSFLGAFNIRIIALVLPVGFVLYLFMRPHTNKDMKHYAALIGLIDMVLSFILP